MSYIDRDCLVGELIAATHGQISRLDKMTGEELLAVIDRVPNEEVEPIIYGHWVEIDDTDGWACSECGTEICGYDENPAEYGTVRCCNCGAHMENL